MNRSIAILFTLALLLALSSNEAFAQGCSMCGQAVESNMDKDGNGFGKGLNSAILYLMAFPYIVFMCIAFYFRKKWIGFFRKLMIR